jgi:hypothetical protein
LPPLLVAALAVDTTAAVQAASTRGQSGPALGVAVHEARVCAVEAALR